MSSADQPGLDSLYRRKVVLLDNNEDRLPGHVPVLWGEDETILVDFVDLHFK